MSKCSGSAKSSNLHVSFAGTSSRHVYPSSFFIAPHPTLDAECLHPDPALITLALMGGGVVLVSTVAMRPASDTGWWIGTLLLFSS